MQSWNPQAGSSGYPPGSLQQGAPPGYGGAHPGGPAQNFGGQQAGYGGQAPGVGGPTWPDQSQSFGGAQPGKMSAYGGVDPSTGAPPGQYQAYDLSNYAATKAEADLAHLEKKKKRHDIHNTENQVDRTAHRIRLNEQATQENQSCATWLCLWSIFNASLYLLAVLSDDWMVRQWHTISIKQLEVRMGLRSLQITLECSSSSYDLKLCNMMKPWAEHDEGSGRWTTKEFQERICDDPKGDEYCSTGRDLNNCGWPPMILLPAAAGFECLAMMLLYAYWHASPTRFIRELSTRCAAAAWCCAAGALLGWTALKPWMNTFPRMWYTLGEQHTAGAGSFSGFIEASCLPIGLGCALFVLGFIGTCLRMMAQLSMAFHHNEPDPFGTNEPKETDTLLEEATAEAEKQLYGTTKA